MGARESGKLRRMLESRANVTHREREIDELYDDLTEMARPSVPVRLGECRPPDVSGAYVFFEPGELRQNGRPRVVRVGESANLRSRLVGCHLRGSHRNDSKDDQRRLLASVFRKHVGFALMERDGVSCQTWGARDVPSSTDALRKEAALEERVTGVLSAMSVQWLVVGRVERKACEREMIGLLSNRRRPVDPPSEDWLGSSHPRREIRDSGLWNIEHVD